MADVRAYDAAMRHAHDAAAVLRVDALRVRLSLMMSPRVAVAFAVPKIRGVAFAPLRLQLFMVIREIRAMRDVMRVYTPAR